MLVYLSYHSFEQETEEKLLQKTLDLQIQYSLTKEQNQKYKNELDLIKEYFIYH